MRLRSQLSFRAQAGLGLSAAILLTACQGNGGAITTQWMLTNLSTGAMFRPSDVAAISGSCCPQRIGGACDASNPWIVTKVAIALAGVDSGPAPPLDCSASATPSALVFDCAAGEHTTNFVVPPGDYAISLQACAFDGNGNAINVAVPSPEAWYVAT
jgi:hypothetical protein